MVSLVPITSNFNPRAPCGARRLQTILARSAKKFQPTRPLRGATGLIRDAKSARRWHFNPRAPCGARRIANMLSPEDIKFQPTRPLRGATARGVQVVQNIYAFQPTRPLRGATYRGRGLVRYDVDFNPRAPCGARLHAFNIPAQSRDFNPRAPCGARPCGMCTRSKGNSLFQPTRPLRGATRHKIRIPHGAFVISTHAPLAGRDGGLYCR